RRGAEKNRPRLVFHLPHRNRSKRTSALVPDQSFTSRTVLGLSIRAFSPPVPEFDLWAAIISSSICHTAIARTVSRDAGSITPPSRKERPQPMRIHHLPPGSEIGHSGRDPQAKSTGSPAAQRQISNRLPRRLESVVSRFVFNRSQNSNRRKTALFRHRLLAGLLPAQISVRASACPPWRIANPFIRRTCRSNPAWVLFHPSLLRVSVPPWPIL